MTKFELALWYEHVSTIGNANHELMWVCSDAIVSDSYSEETIDQWIEDLKEELDLEVSIQMSWRPIEGWDNNSLFKNTPISHTITTNEELPF